MSDQPLDRQIARAYLEAEGLRVQDDIHPRDEMLSVIGRHGARAEAVVRFDYMKAGREAMRVVEDVLASANVDLRTARVLEFGCGFGRVTRFLAGRCDALTVTDVHDTALDFTAGTWDLPRVPSVVESAAPAGGPYDLVLALSVLNHLPAPRFRGWLTALLDALRPGGILCFSTHDAGLIAGMPADDEGYTFVPESESGHLDPREYGSAFAAADLVEAALRDAGGGRPYRSPRELWFFQDLWVVAKGTDLAALDERRPATNLRGRAESIRVHDDGRCVATGWAADMRDGAPLDRVRLLAGPAPGNVQPIGEAALGLDSRGQAQYMGRDDFAAAGWRFEGQWPAGAAVLWVEGTAGTAVQRFDVAALEWAPGRQVIIE